MIPDTKENGIIMLGMPIGEVNFVKKSNKEENREGEESQNRWQMLKRHK